MKNQVFQNEQIYLLLAEKGLLVYAKKKHSPWKKKAQKALQPIKKKQATEKSTKALATIPLLMVAR